MIFDEAVEIRDRFRRRMRKRGDERSSKSKALELQSAVTRFPMAGNEPTLGGQVTAIRLSSTSELFSSLNYAFETMKKACSIRRNTRCFISHNTISQSVHCIHNCYATDKERYCCLKSVSTKNKRQSELVMYADQRLVRGGFLAKVHRETRE
ncbi:hypothetical protein J6590_096869 [Homalodisca vitripennis]|nr:hypothetical protein J6590_096869 [Homalodisca vitripennis]